MEVDFTDDSINSLGLQCNVPFSDRNALQLVRLELW